MKNIISISIYAFLLIDKNNYIYIYYISQFDIYKLDKISAS